MVTHLPQSNIHPELALAGSMLIELCLSLQLETIYKKAHAAIRSDPAHKKAAVKGGAKKRWTAKRLTHAERHGKVADRKAAFLAKLKAEADA